MRTVWLRVAVGLIASLTAGFSIAGDKDESKQLAVVSAAPDLRIENLTLEGVNFGVVSGDVTLEGRPTTVISWADSRIVIKLPAEVVSTPGSYLVAVVRPKPKGKKHDDDDDDEGKRTGFFIATVGAVGPQGEKGDMGPQGKVGPQGPKGDKGDQGVQGIQGVQGAKGDKGDTGAQGPKGDQGIQGTQGLKGDKGDQGIQGLQGVKGDKGETGSQGAPGIQGIQGPQGPEGPAGPSGAQGFGFPGSPLLLLKLDESSGNSAADSSGNGNNGNVGGSVTLGVSGASGSAFRFDGSAGSYVQIPYGNGALEPPTTQISVSAWVNASSFACPAGQCAIVSNEGVPGEGTWGYGLRIIDNGARLQWCWGTQNGPGDCAYGPYPFTTGTWTHVAGTYDGTALKAYVNGVLVARNANQFPALNTTKDLYVGRLPSGDLPWQGAIDDVRVYTRTLVASQLEQLSLVGPQGPAGPKGDPGVAGQNGAQGGQGPQGIQGIQGAQGVPGPTGPKGDQGDKGDAASSALNWRGNFACGAGTTFAPGDAVQFQGSAYFTTAPIANCAAPPSAPWQLVASPGDSFTLRGEFLCNAGTHYQPGDAVTLNGAEWINGGSQATGGCVEPPNAPWRVLRPRGTFLCDSVTIYEAGDIVVYNGEEWLNDQFAIGGCINPPNAPWRRFTRRGQYSCDSTTQYQPGEVVKHQGADYANGGASSVGGCTTPPQTPWRALVRPVTNSFLVSSNIGYGGGANAVPAVSTLYKPLGPSIYSATPNACGFNAGQLTTQASCSANACQERGSDDHSPNNICGAGAQATFLSSTPIGHYACPAGSVDLFGDLSCMTGIIGFGGSFVPPVLVSTTYNVCFRCDSIFTELGRLVK